MKPVIRKVNADEINFYVQRLYPLQDKILNLFEGDKFYLTGGTCLSRFYFDHRYSEDLDFFFDGFNSSISNFETDYLKYISRIKNMFTTEITVASEHFKRVFVKENEISLKLEFVFEPYPHIGPTLPRDNFRIDSKENVAVNKLTAVYSRKTAKDFFDIYYLLKEFELKDLLKKTEIKMIPPSYEELIISLHDTFFEGEILTNQSINEESFFSFIDSFTKDLFEYAKHV